MVFTCFPSSACRHQVLSLIACSSFSLPDSFIHRPEFIFLVGRIWSDQVLWIPGNCCWPLLSFTISSLESPTVVCCFWPSVSLVLFRYTSSRLHQLKVFGSCLFVSLGFWFNCLITSFFLLCFIISVCFNGECLLQLYVRH